MKKMLKLVVGLCMILGLIFTLPYVSSAEMAAEINVDVMDEHNIYINVTGIKNGGVVIFALYKQDKILADCYTMPFSGDKFVEAICIKNVVNEYKYGRVMVWSSLSELSPLASYAEEIFFDEYEAEADRPPVSSGGGGGPAQGYLIDVAVEKAEFGTAGSVDVYVQMLTENGVEVFEVRNNAKLNTCNDENITLAIKDWIWTDSNYDGYVEHSELDAASLLQYNAIENAKDKAVLYTVDAYNDITLLIEPGYTDVQLGMDKIGIMSNSTVANNIYDANARSFASGEVIQPIATVFLVNRDAEQCYTISPSQLTDGAEYTTTAFYNLMGGTEATIVVIDASSYGNLEELEPPEDNTVISGYGYLMDVAAEETEFGSAASVNVKIQMLTENGVEVFCVNNNAKVYINGFDKVVLGINDWIWTDTDSDGQIEASELDSDAYNKYNLIAALKTKVIKYTTNSLGKITGFIESTNSNAYMAVLSNSEIAENVFDADAMSFESGQQIEADAIIFVVDKNDAENCCVVSPTQLTDGVTYTTYGFYRTYGSEYADIIVIDYNSFIN